MVRYGSGTGGNAGVGPDYLTNVGNTNPLTGGALPAQSNPNNPLLGRTGPNPIANPMDWLKQFKGAVSPATGHPQLQGPPKSDIQAPDLSAMLQDLINGLQPKTQFGGLSAFGGQGGGGGMGYGGFAGNNSNQMYGMLDNMRNQLLTQFYTPFLFTGAYGR